MPDKGDNWKRGRSKKGVVVSKQEWRAGRGTLNKTLVRVSRTRRYLSPCESVEDGHVLNITNMCSVNLD